MDVFSAAKKRRTIRKFAEKKVPFRALEDCVEAARLAPSARNTQELDFIAVDNKQKVSELNNAVSFGGVVREKGRAKGEEAKAFIIIIAEKEKSNPDYTGINAGIASEAISLVAFENGLGSCIMGAINREKIKPILSIPENFSVLLAIALGYPKEKPIAEEASGKELKYWIDEKGQLHVPKRKKEDVLHRNGF